MKVVLKASVIVLLIISFAMSAQAQEKFWNELTSEIVMLYQQGEYAEATKLANEALTDAEKTFGSNHPRVATSLNNLALLCKTQGKYAEAESLYKQALKIWEKALGPENIDVAVVYENMAALYNQIGKDDEAEKLEARARKIRSK